MSQIIAVCGLDCSQCEAYVATQANDREHQERLLAKWRVDYNQPDMPIGAVICDGCIGEGRHGGYCQDCPIRACAGERGFENCAYCGDYETCEQLNKFFGMAPGTKANLDAIRATL